MTIEEIIAINDWDKILVELKQDPFEDRKSIEKNIDYYNNKHPILTDPSRANYNVTKEVTEKYTDSATGKTKTRTTTKTETVKRTKLVIPTPRQIVGTGAAMMFGEPVELILNDEKDSANKEVFENFSNIWIQGGFDTFNHKVFRATAIESMCAELLFVSNPDGSAEEKMESIKPMLFSVETGDEIYPHFNDQRLLDALTRVYTKRVIEDGNFTDVEVTEIYTDKGVYKRVGEDGDFDLEALPYEKLTIVYYDQLHLNSQMLISALGIRL